MEYSGTDGAFDVLCNQAMICHSSLSLTVYWYRFPFSLWLCYSYIVVPSIVYATAMLVFKIPEMF